MTYLSNHGHEDNERSDDADEDTLHFTIVGDYLKLARRAVDDGSLDVVSRGSLDLRCSGADHVAELVTVRVEAQ